jgi:hypothetical protein
MNLPRTPRLGQGVEYNDSDFADGGGCFLDPLRPLQGERSDDVWAASQGLDVDQWRRGRRRPVRRVRVTSVPTGRVDGEDEAGFAERFYAGKLCGWCEQDDTMRNDVGGEVL